MYQTLGAFEGVYQGCRRVNYLSKTSAVPTIWAKCFALTTQKFNKGRTKPNLSPNGDRSGYKFRSVQGRGQAFFGETSWNGTSQALWAEPLAGSTWNGTSGARRLP